MDFFNSIEINKKNLIDNLKTIKNKAKNKKICAMVKANAYGHDLKTVVLTLKNNVDFFGVANTEEALKIRNYAYKNKILLCGAYNKDKLKNLILNKISLTVFSFFQLKEILKECKIVKEKAYLHIKINTGMNRLGIKNIKSLKVMLNFINKNNNYLILEGVFSHLFNSESKELSNSQYLKFINFIKNIKNLNCINIHFENSRGLFNNVDYLNICNMVRVGISLYGLEIENEKLKPVLSVKSQIIEIQKVNEEEYVGYGKTIIERDGRVAILPLGYADGILRNYKNNYVYVNDKPCKIINVCMDMILVDITNVNSKVGDVVTVISNDNKKLNSVSFISKNVNTISYEIVTKLNQNRFNLHILAAL